MDTANLVQREAQSLKKVKDTKTVSLDDVLYQFDCTLPELTEQLFGSESDKLALVKIGSFLHYCLGVVPAQEVTALIKTLTEGCQQQIRLLSAMIHSGSDSAVITNNNGTVQALTDIVMELGAEAWLLSHDSMAWSLFGSRLIGLMVLLKLPVVVLSSASAKDLTSLFIELVRVNKATMFDETVKQWVKITQQANAEPVRQAALMVKEWLASPDRVFNESRQHFRAETSLNGIVSDGFTSRKPLFVRVGAVMTLFAMDEEELASHINKCRNKSVIASLIKALDMTPMSVMMNPYLKDDKKTQCLELLNQSIS